MHTVPLNLGGLEIYLASHSPIETFGLPDGARLIELGDGTAVINRGGGVELLPPIQPEPVSPASHAASQPSSAAGEVRTGYLLPIAGLTAFLALAGLTVGTLTGTLAQITRGMFPNNTPPVIAAQQGSDGGLEAAVTSTPTPQIRTPTPQPTYTPTATATPRPTATPVPDPFGLRANKFKPVTDVSQVQFIVDYFDQKLMGTNLIGHDVPVKISAKEEFARVAKIYVPKLDPERQFAFGTWDNIINGKAIGYKIHIQSGRPLWEVVNALCDEGAKAHSITNNPNILGNNYRDNLVNEASSLPFQRACTFVLEPSGYDAFRIAKTRSNETYISNTLLPFYLVPKGDRFDGVLAVPWVAARELGLDALLERPDKRLSIDEELELFRHINSKSPDYWRAKLNTNPPDFEAIRQISIARLTPSIREDTSAYNIIFPIGLISFYAP